MATYTSAELAVKCSKSERHIQRLLQSGKLQATHIDNTNRWEVSDEALLPWLPHETTDDLLDRISALEMAVMQLQRLTAKLEALVEETTAAKAKAPEGHSRRSERPKPDIVGSLPDGAVPLLTFARQHAMNTNSVRYQLAHGLIHVSSMPHPARPGQNEYFVLPEQMAQLVLRWQGNDNFSPCPDCPHQT